MLLQNSLFGHTHVPDLQDYMQHTQAYRAQLVSLATCPLLQIVHHFILILEASDPAPINILLHVKDALIQHSFHLSSTEQPSGCATAVSNIAQNWLNGQRTDSTLHAM